MANPQKNNPQEASRIIEVTPENVGEEKLFCIKDIKSPGFERKVKWLLARYKEGLKLKILKNGENKQLAFIEYIPAEYAWRPIEAKGYMFIQCMFVYSKKDKGKGLGSILIKDCEEEARLRKMEGVCTITSSGSWMADQRVFEKNGYDILEQKGRFELLAKKFSKNTEEPKFLDWEAQQRKYTGWNLIYSDQCPWHERAVTALLDTAVEHGIELRVEKLINPDEAKKAPSGFGTFSLLRDGRLLEDHYISQTRFKNILKKELTIG